jgi:hypothetical protein
VRNAFLSHHNGTNGNDGASLLLSSITLPANKEQEQEGEHARPVKSLFCIRSFSEEADTHRSNRGRRNECENRNKALDVASSCQTRNGKTTQIDGKRSRSRLHVPSPTPIHSNALSLTSLSFPLACSFANTFSLY